MRGYRLITTVLLGATFALACNELSGLADLVVEEPDASLPSADGGPPVDASPGATDAAPPSPPPTCACAAAPPAGWTGPAIVLPVAGAAPAACPTGLVPTVTGGADPKGDGCSPCTCGALTGACETAMVQTANGSCGNPCTMHGGAFGPKPVTTACSPLTYCAPTSGASAIMALDGGSCPASGGVRGAAAFARSATACAFASPPSGSCAAGESCAPKSEGAPNAPICVVRAGEHPCPPGPYSARSIYYAGLDDRRACSPCTCTASSGCTAATVTVYQDTACTQGLASVSAASGPCATFTVATSQGSAKITMPGTAQSATCTPQGGAPSGALAPQGPTTLCCTR